MIRAEAEPGTKTTGSKGEGSTIKVLKAKMTKQAPFRNWEGNMWALENAGYDSTLRVVPAKTGAGGVMRKALTCLGRSTRGQRSTGPP